MANSNILDNIGNTPLVRLDSLCPEGDVSVFGKLEMANPTGSMKDRIALRMIEGAEERGELDSGRTVIEATSGNTGISLGMVCTVKGYRCNVLMTETKSVERRFMLRYWGCELTLTSGDDPDSSIWEAKAMAETEPEKYFYINQSENEDNILAHYEGTGPEIIKDLNGKVDAFVAGFGTGGTLMGVGRALREAGTGARLVAVEPTSLKSRIEGIKYSEEGYMPTIFDGDQIDEVVRVRDEDAIETARLLATREGIMAGISSGATVWTAVQLAKKMNRGNIVAIIADRGERYFSTPLFDGVRNPSE